MKKRELRRDLTYRYSKRAQKTHIRVNHSDGKIDCICELADWYFRKRKSLGCSCRSKYKGTPKIARKHGAAYHPRVVERIAGNRMLRALKRFLRDHDPEDFEG